MPLESWPPEVLRSDLATFFTLSIDDIRWVRTHQGDAQRLGIAVQLAALGFLGYIPADVSAAPSEVVVHIADQVGVAAGSLTGYGEVSDWVR